MQNASVVTEELLGDGTVLNHAAALFALLTRFGFFSASVFALITVNMSMWNRTWSPASITQAILRLPSVALAMQTGPSTFERIFKPGFEIPTIPKGAGKENANVFQWPEWRHENRSGSPNVAKKEYEELTSTSCQ
jgi:hypothetical protein